MKGLATVNVNKAFTALSNYEKLKAEFEAWLYSSEGRNKAQHNYFMQKAGIWQRITKATPKTFWHKKLEYLKAEYGRTEKQHIRLWIGGGNIPKKFRDVQAFLYYSTPSIFGNGLTFPWDCEYQSLCCLHNAATDGTIFVGEDLSNFINVFVDLEI